MKQSQSFLVLASGGSKMQMLDNSVSITPQILATLSGLNNMKSGGEKSAKTLYFMLDVSDHRTAVIWRKVLLVLKVILRYGRLKFFCSLDQKKAPRKAWRWPHLKI